MTHARSPRPVLVVALVLGLAPSVGAAPRPASTTDLLAADRAFAQATAEHGAAGWGSFFAADGVMVPPSGALPHGGPAAAEAAMQGLFADPKAFLRWQPEQAVLAQSGELGYTIGTYELHAVGAGGKPVSRTGRYLTVWRRQADGAWKVLADIGNVAPPAPPQAQPAASPEKP